MIFVSSWDDGHPLDERLGDLLGRFGLKGTFFVPLTNREGLPVMSLEAIRRLSGDHEIGSHTLDHVYLSGISDEVMHEQIRGGKRALEDCLGHRVPGFCYPGGEFGSKALKAVRDAGFAYARTIENLRVDFAANPFRLATTLQFYPHPNSVLVRNLLRYPERLRKVPLFLRLLRARSFTHHLRTALGYAAEHDGILHVWGHSWELERFQLWGVLEDFLREVAAHRPRALTMNELISKH